MISISSEQEGRQGADQASAAAEEIKLSERKYSSVSSGFA